MGRYCVRLFKALCFERDRSSERRVLFGVKVVERRVRSDTTLYRVQITDHDPTKGVDDELRPTSPGRWGNLVREVRDRTLILWTHGQDDTVVCTDWNVLGPNFYLRRRDNVQNLLPSSKRGTERESRTGWRRVQSRFWTLFVLREGTGPNMYSESPFNSVLPSERREEYMSSKSVKIISLRQSLRRTGGGRDVLVSTGSDNTT